MPSDPQFRGTGPPDRLDTPGEDRSRPAGTDPTHPLADLVAAGKVPFPRDLPAEAQRHLRRAVRERLRRRLVRLVAAAIARDILTARRPEE